jgi:hypothetical protein
MGHTGARPKSREGKQVTTMNRFLDFMTWFVAAWAVLVVVTAVMVARALYLMRGREFKSPADALRFLEQERKRRPFWRWRR